MSNPFDQFDEPPDYVSFARQEAERAGLSPDLVTRVMSRESSGDPSAVSPKGARGLMQLMPGTAEELGVNPDDPYDNIRGGVRYLKQQMDAFGGDERLALAAYNAGPGAVQRHGGVPPFAETQAYVDALAPQGGANPFDQFDEAPAAQDETEWETIAQGDAGVSIEVERPRPAPVPGRPAGYQPKGPKGNPLTRTIERAAAAGGEAWNDLAAEVGHQYRNPGKDQLGTAKMLAKAANVPLSAVGSIIDDFTTEPLAKALDAIPLDAYEAPKLSFEGGRPRLTQGRKLNAEEKHEANRGAASTALMAGRPASYRLGKARYAARHQTRVPGATLTEQVRAVTPQVAPKAAATKAAPSLEEVKRANSRAWQKVDGSGYRFPQEEVEKMAVAVRRTVDEAGPELYPEADKVARRIETLAARGELTPAQANRLRSQVGEKLLSPGSTEGSVGGEIKSKIDALIEAGDVPDLKEARRLYARLRKMEEVSERVESADLAKTTSGNGRNMNSVRQKLRPLIDPKSPQRIRNLTPEEVKALKRVVKGSPGQNIARVASAFDPFKGKLSTLLHSGAAIGTGGLSLLTAPVGMGGSLAEGWLAERNLKRAIDLIARGGKAPPKAAARPGVNARDAAAVLQALQILPERRDVSRKKTSSRPGR